MQSDELLIKVIKNLKEKLEEEKYQLLEFNLVGNKRYYLSIEEGNLKYNKILKIKNDAPFNINKFLDVKHLHKISHELSSENFEDISFIFRLQPKIRIGDEYLPILAKDLFISEEKFLLNSSGISIIDHLGDWSAEKVYSMNNNMELIERNINKWKDSVKFFCTAYSIEESLGFIDKWKLNKFPQMLQFFVREKNKEDDIVYLNPWFNNYLIIVDSNRILRHCGKIDNVDIEKLVNSLIEIDSSEKLKNLMISTDMKEKKSEKNSEITDKCLFFIKQFEKIFENLENKNYNMELTIKYSEKFEIDLLKIQTNNKYLSEFSFHAKCYLKEYEMLNSFFNQFTKDELMMNKININIKLIETIDIILSKEPVCYSCKKAIDIKIKTTYFCWICNLFFCYECIQLKTSYSGFAALLHKEHYLIAFNNPNLENFKNIELDRLGKNAFSRKTEIDLSRNHDFDCHICPQKKKSDERYICLNCYPGGITNKYGGGLLDVCSGCFGYLYEKNKIEILKNHVHKPNHIYLHLIYEGDSYMDY